MNTYSESHLNPVEGYFRRSKQTSIWNVPYILSILLGGTFVAYGLIEQQISMTIGGIIAILIVGVLALRRKNHQIVKVSLKNGKLLVKGGGYHIQLQAPFRYQTGVERIRATRRTPEYHYVRMVLDIYGKPLVLEEQVPSGIQPPKLDEIVGVSSALGIAELSSVKPYPGTLWTMIQQLEAVTSRGDQEKLKQDIESLYRIGGQQLQVEHFAEAIKIFSEIIRLTPESPYPYYNRGMARFYHRRDFDKAITDLTTALRLNPKFAKAYRMRGLVKAEQGDWEGLRDDTTSAIKLSPNDSDLYNLRGGACYRLQDYQSALSDFNRAIELDHNKPEPFHNRGLVKQKQRDLDGALADFYEALRLNPVFELARQSIAQVEYEKRQHEVN